MNLLPGRLNDTIAMNSYNFNSNYLLICSNTTIVMYFCQTDDQSAKKTYVVRCRSLKKLWLRSHVKHDRHGVRWLINLKIKALIIDIN